MKEWKDDKALFALIMDIYRSYFRKEAGQKELVHTGRWVSFGSLLIAVLIAPMLSGLDQAFRYI